MKISVIVALAGTGKRMNSSVAKQFLMLDDRPIFLHTIEALEKISEIGEIIVVADPTHYVWMNTLFAHAHITKVSALVPGGKERQDSIENGLKAVGSAYSFVAVQDGVRPFVKKSYFSKGLQQLSENDSLSGVVVGVFAKDTMKRVSEAGVIVETPLRSTMFHAHTPQIFRKERLITAFEEAKKQGYQGTDDASLLELIGDKVGVVVGEYENIKITTPGDLLIAKEWLKGESK